MKSVPARVLKENSDLFLSYLSYTSNYFSNKLKSEDISLLFKKDDAVIKKNF